MVQQLGGTSDVDSNTMKCTEHILSQHSDVVPTKIRIFIVYLFGFCLHVPFLIIKDLRLPSTKTEMMMTREEETLRSSKNERNSR